jgi:hypothetical protein
LAKVKKCRSELALRGVVSIDTLSLLIGVYNWEDQIQEVRDADLIEDLAAIRVIGLSCYEYGVNLSAAALVLRHPENLFAWAIKSPNYRHELMLNTFDQVCFRYKSSSSRPSNPRPFYIFLREKGFRYHKKGSYSALDELLHTLHAIFILCIPLSLSRFPQKVWLTRDLLRLLKGYLLRH